MEEKRYVEPKERLIEMMSILDLKQTDIAEKTGIPKSAISQYVSGKRLPRIDKIAIIANAYGLNPTWLLGYNNVPMYKADVERRAEKEYSLVRKYRQLSERDQQVIDKMIDSMLESH